MPQLSEQPYFHNGVDVRGSTFGRYCEIGEGGVILQSSFDDYSYCGRFADIAYSSIGKFSNIAAFVRINPGEHPHERASLHHFMYRSSYYWPEEQDEARIFEWRRSLGCNIGHDTWIGHGAIVMKGVRIGHGAIIASLAVVTKDIPPYAVYGGVPAQFIKWRHPLKTADRLQNLQWWDWSHEKLRLALPDFRALSAEAFLDKYEQKNVTQPLQTTA